MRFAVFAAVMLLFTSVGFAYVAEVDISDAVCVYNEEDEFRILLKFDDIGISDSYSIDFASIVLPKTQDSVVVAFEVSAVTKSWSAASPSLVSWDSEDGDISDEPLSTWVIHPGVGTSGHFIDVTDYIREIVRGEDAYGLVLKPLEDDEAGFSADAASVFSGLDNLKLRILYRRKD
jgi:hypothetical protein